MDTCLIKLQEMVWQESLPCCSPLGCKDSDTTEPLNSNNILLYCSPLMIHAFTYWKSVVLNSSLLLEKLILFSFLLFLKILFRFILFTYCIGFATLKNHHVHIRKLLIMELFTLLPPYHLLDRSCISAPASCNFHWTELISGHFYMIVVNVSMPFSTLFHLPFSPRAQNFCFDTSVSLLLSR